MNTKIILTCTLAATAAMAVSAKGKSDPVLMSVNGVDVPLSEFLYLYEKNNAQQVEPLSLEEYVDMFVDYKLKVADAKAEGVDTLQSFENEYAKFRYELAEPFLVDPDVNEALIMDVYNRMGNEVLVSHIMLPPLSAQSIDGEQKADSIRQAILNGEISFEEAAAQYSVDRASRVRGGVMGWMSANSRVPWMFEKVAFETPVGELSQVVNSGFGYHIIKPLEKRQNLGEVKAEHILLLTQGKSATEAAKIKERIDSIYQIAIQEGVDFGELARKYSQDPGSAMKGGDLGWFGTGKMVPEFEAVAFELPIGGISEPFATSYGYHIIHKSAQRERAKLSLEEARPIIQKAIDNDTRKQEPMRVAVERKALATHSAVNKDLVQQLAQFLAKQNEATIDSAALQALLNCDITAYTINGKNTTVNQCIAGVPGLRTGIDNNTAVANIVKICNSNFNRAITNLMIDELEATNTEFSNLTHEYRDGIMLFEVANNKVWDKASKDTAGQEAYFQSHRDKYHWNAPKFKGYVVQCSNDSVMNAAKELLKDVDPNISQADLNKMLKSKFARDIRLDLVIAAEGENPIIDYIAFNGPEPKLSPNQKLRYFFAFDGKMLDQPQSVEDVRGSVITDYQSALEQEWLADLHKKYPVKINQKVLKNIK